MRTREFLPNPRDFYVSGFWRNLWSRLQPRRKVFMLREYVRAVHHADVHNHEICVGFIHEIDEMRNYLGENIRPTMRAEDLLQFAADVQAGYTTVDGTYPWEGYD